MSRKRGLTSYSSNFEIKNAAPIDARLVVGFYADLLDHATWIDEEGGIFTYVGMPVYVYADAEPSRGVYVLNTEDYTLPNSWTKLGESEIDRAYVDGSLAQRDIATNVIYIYAEDISTNTSKWLLSSDASIDYIRKNYVINTSLGEGLFWNDTTFKWDVSVEGGGGGEFNEDISTSHVWYDTALDPNLEVGIDIGGIKAGTTAGDLYGKNMTELLDDLLFPTMNPNITPPSRTFTATHSGLREINASLNIEFTASYNRGKIEPAYGTNGYRSGEPWAYTYTGPQLDISSLSSALSNIQNVTNHIVTLGSQTWTNTITYNSGDQPLNNKGDWYDFVYPGGTTAPISITITGVYPYFATTVDMDTSKKQTLASMTATYWEIKMAAEAGIKKQRAWFPQAFKEITGIQVFNTNNNQWDWVNLSKANSILTFTKTPLTIYINEVSVGYWLYEHNEDLIGKRDLRFYTT